MHVTSSACIFGGILGSCESAVFPLSGCGQFGRRSKIELMNIQISKCDRSVWREFLLTEKVKLHLYYHSSISYTCTDIVYLTKLQVLVTKLVHNERSRTPLTFRQSGH